MPGPGRSSTSWSRSPTPRSSGSRTTAPPRLEVRKAQNERESELIMGLQSVTRKAAVLNEYMDRLRRSAGLSDRAREGLRRHARGRQASGQAVPRARIGSSSTSYPARRPRGAPRRPSTAAKQAPLASPPVVEINDDFDRSIMPQLWPDTPLHAATVRAAHAFKRPGAPDRRAPRAADRDGRPGRQVGRDLDTQGQGGPGLARRQPARRGDENARRPADGRRAGRDRLDPRRRRRAGIDDRQPDHAHTTPEPRRSTCTPT